MSSDNRTLILMKLHAISELVGIEEQIKERIEELRESVKKLEGKQGDIR